MSQKRADPPLSIGGFKGLPSKVVTQHQQRPRSSSMNNSSKRFARNADGTPVDPAIAAAASHNVPSHHTKKIEEAVIKLASVPFDGWNKEKESRVKVAFDRILEHEWYDKYEGNLKAVELVHINAVREHYAMRRDKIQTPDINAKKGSNTMPALQWAENMEAINDLKPGTCVREHFTDLLKKKASARRRERTEARNMSTVLPPDGTAQRNHLANNTSMVNNHLGSAAMKKSSMQIPDISPFEDDDFGTKRKSGRARAGSGRPAPFSHHQQQVDDGDDEGFAPPGFSDFKKAAATGMW